MTKHQYQSIKDSEYDDLRIATADADNIKVGPFDDCDAILTDKGWGEENEISMYALRCEKCGAFFLESPFGGDYTAFLGPGTYRECPTL